MKNYIVTRACGAYRVTKVAHSLETLQSEFAVLEDAVALFADSEVLASEKVAGICFNNADVLIYDGKFEEWLNIGNNM